MTNIFPILLKEEVSYGLLLVEITLKPKQYYLMHVSSDYNAICVMDH